jgi:(E)-4-hydroxy-3-methylbut-2-enyl-diphosphate synthase
VSTPETTIPPFSYARRPTRRVLVGSVALGGREPIRVQSMTTTLTGDTEATAQQTLALAESGCEIVRVTVPNMGDAHSLEAYRKRLDELGVDVPIVADIHFNPRAAMVAADFCEKVRVNPGNYVDSKRFDVREYTDAEYEAELGRIREGFSPLVEKCKRLGRAMRIGTNHGSLSDRIMNRFGDSPLGMVESALEFVRICREHDYHELVLSMKSSNPFVAVQAYRLLADRMAAEDMDYPFHLGVTEAGDGDDARIKSAIGIGSLLADGIGDTVRVSLTEDPVHEVPVAEALVAPFNALIGGEPRELDIVAEDPRRVHELARRTTVRTQVGERALGGSELVQVWLDLGSGSSEALADRAKRWASPPRGAAPLADLVHLTVDDATHLEAVQAVKASLSHFDGTVPLAITAAAGLVVAEPSLLAAADLVLLRPDESLSSAAAQLAETGTGAGVSIHGEDEAELATSAAAAAGIVRDATGASPLIALDTAPGLSPVHATRLLNALIHDTELEDAPLLLIDSSARAEGFDSLLEGAQRLGGLLVDGLGDAIRIDCCVPETANRRAFGVLQATRLRMSRPDYISCPSCGRTLFDLEETTARIKAVTSHLIGVKIAIMGCIVNGPGEMADADFGYVGSSPGKVNLYLEKDCVVKNVDASEAPDRLVDLIKEHGRWIEPDEATAGTGAGA